MRFKQIIWSVVIFSVGAFATDIASAPDIQYSPGITMTKAIQESITPDQAIHILQAGNKRFLDGQPVPRNFSEQIQQTAYAQHPFATIVSCIDSRSGPEVIFDQGIGDIFVARVAGNVMNDDILGSIEFSTKVAGSKAVIVLGHTNCGAVKGACDGVQLGNLTGLLEKITPAVDAAQTDGDRSGNNESFVNTVAALNVHNTIKTIRERSTILQDLEAQGAIRIIGAMYDDATGRVTWDS
jgi:carbonic anhydrase